MKKLKFISALLAVIMLITALGAPVFAADLVKSIIRKTINIIATIVNIVIPIFTPMEYPCVVIMPKKRSIPVHTSAMPMKREINDFSSRVAKLETIVTGMKNIGIGMSE